MNSRRGSALNPEHLYRSVAHVLHFLIELSNTIDIIAVTKQRHKGVLDSIRGSVFEQVLRHAQYPVLAEQMSRSPETVDGEEE